MVRLKKKRPVLGPTIQSKPDFCPVCDGRRIIKRGLRKNSFRQLQIYWCKDCGGYFSSLTGLKGVKYPPRVIARALCLYNLGHSQEDTARLSRENTALRYRDGRSPIGSLATDPSLPSIGIALQPSYSSATVW